MGKEARKQTLVPGSPGLPEGPRFPSHSTVIIPGRRSLGGRLVKLQYFGPPDEKNQLIGKDPDAGKD